MLLKSIMALKILALFLITIQHMINETKITKIKNSIEPRLLMKVSTTFLLVIATTPVYGGVIDRFKREWGKGANAFGYSTKHADNQRIPIKSNDRTGGDQVRAGNPLFWRDMTPESKE